MVFTFSSNAELVFGVGAESNLERLLRANQARSILFVYSGNYVFDLGIHRLVTEVSSRIGAELIESGSVVPNPRIELVRELIQTSREHHVDFVLAAGGASSFDTAKAVGIGVLHDHDVWDFFTGKTQPKSTLPVGVISTIPGSGSELSDCAVLQLGHDKRALETNVIVPKFAIVNPEYSRSAPYRYQAAAVADLAVGFLEPYFTDKAHIESADRLLEGGFIAAINAGKRFASDPADLQVRTELHWLSAVMYNHCFLATGSENDWTTHRLEHEIGGQFDVIHGEGIAAILPSIIRYVSNRKPQRYAQLAVRALHADPFDSNDKQLAELLANALEQYFDTLGLATRLSQLGIEQNDFESIAERLTLGDTKTVGNYSPLDKNDVLNVLELAR
ncbi:iron-containing alcohol dehydrogenase [Bifidobacterium aquikefiri]|uniref:iron-containing alcohol dehydrogenase n=1 Tax=Bifidobacterium aquikefiri TaxID=1653207 RepID=UPI0023F270FA|nr:iron-containing alcohol dehydrogenase [Bifidobacterium aquikefiri]